MTLVAKKEIPVSVKGPPLRGPGLECVHHNDDSVLWGMEEWKLVGKEELGRPDATEYWELIEPAKAHGRLANATLLEFFLAHKDRIPFSWVEHPILFPGTVYADPDDGYRVVRALVGRMMGTQWVWTEMLETLVHESPMGKILLISHPPE